MRSYNSHFTSNSRSSIDVERGIDEKAASKVLERSASPLKPRIAAFTVVQNCFAALEAVQHTDYDVIIVQKDLPSLDIRGMLKVVRSMGNNVPFILMHPMILPSQVEEGEPPSALEKSLLEDARKMDYSNILMQPFSPDALCTAISEAIHYNNQEVAEVNRKKQMLRDEEERALKFQAFALGEKTGVLEKPSSAKRKGARKKRRVESTDDEYLPQRPTRQIRNVLEEAKLTEPPSGAYDPAAEYVRILTAMQASKGQAVLPPPQQNKRPMTTSEETAQFLTEMANK